MIVRYFFRSLAWFNWVTSELEVNEIPILLLNKQKPSGAPFIQRFLFHRSLIQMLCEMLHLIVIVYIT